MSNTTSWTLESPDGRLALSFTLNANGVPAWSVAFQGRLMVEANFQLDLRGGVLNPPLAAIGLSRAERADTFPMTSGKCSSVSMMSNEAAVRLCQASDRSHCFDLVFRASNEGVAFRYVVPKQDSLSDFEILNEQFEFRFPEDLRCWALELPSYATPYESEFHPRKLSELTADTLIGFPLTLQTSDGVALALTEAALTDHAGLYAIRHPTAENALAGRLSPLPDEPSVKVRAVAPHASPWRVLLVAETPSKLIESNFILTLNEPSKIEDTSWVKPGRVLWDWWCDDMVTETEGGMNTATMEHFIDFAAEYGLEYMLIDGGWYGPTDKGNADVTKSVPEIDLPHLVSYANERGVDILVWSHWRDLYPMLDKAFAYYESLGIKGVKVDFFDRDDQEIVNICANIVECGARHRLMLDLHGMHKPSGLCRTWPNLITYEGIMGLEYNKWCDRVTPTHNVTIPYTRMLAGPMDYTPGAFRNVHKDEFLAQWRSPMTMGTRCHQLAMYVVYESGLQMVSDYPNALRGQTGVEFLRAVPAAWDTTVALGGAVGEWVALARRRGNDWFVGVMGNETPRTLSLPLDFLGEGTYVASIYEDGPDAERTPTNAAFRTADMDGTSILSVKLASGGGLAVHFHLDQS